MSSGNSVPDTFPTWLLHHAGARAAQPAIREKSRGIWRTRTWGDLAGEVRILAAALSAQGLQRGARVVLVGDNRPRLYAMMAATQWLGAIAAPLYQDATADEMLPLLQQAEPTHVFAENQEQVDKLLAVLPHCPTIRCIVYDVDRGMRHYRQSMLVTYADLLDQGRKLVAAGGGALQAEVDRGSADDAAFLFFTSGTAGPAKGVVLTYRALIDRAQTAVAADSLTDRETAMAYLSPGWIGQTFFAYAQPMVAGYCVCCPESSETMLADLREIGPSYFLATPRVLETLLAQVTLRIEDTGGFNLRLYRSSIALARRAGARTGENLPLGDRLAAALHGVFIRGPLRDVLGMSRIRAAYTTGDAISPDLLTFFRGLGINLKQLYGSTEAGFYLVAQRDGAVRPDAVGAAAAGVEVKVAANREILVRSPGLFVGYFRDPDATGRARDADGWLRTGDAGHLDETGELRIIDRLENIGALKDGTPFAPRSLENRLKTVGYIKEAVVVGNGRDAVCALIDIDPVAVGRWADRQAMSYTGHADLASRDEVYDLIAAAVARVNAELAADAALAPLQIRRFVLLPKELDADDGLLTRTGKLRRDAIAARFRPVLDAIDAGQDAVRFDTGSDPAGDLKIRSVNGAAASGARKAA